MCIFYLIFSIKCVQFYMSIWFPLCLIAFCPASEGMQTPSSIFKYLKRGGWGGGVTGDELTSSRWWRSEEETQLERKKNICILFCLNESVWAESAHFVLQSFCSQRVGVMGGCLVQELKRTHFLCVTYLISRSTQGIAFAFNVHVSSNFHFCTFLFTV